MARFGLFSAFVSFPDVFLLFGIRLNGREIDAYVTLLFLLMRECCFSLWKKEIERIFHSYA